MLIIQTAIDIITYFYCWRRYRFIGTINCRGTSQEKHFFAKGGKIKNRRSTLFIKHSFNYKEAVVENILLLHVMSGCDTIYAFFNKEKLKFFSLWQITH